MVDNPGHRSRGCRGGEPSADANCPSPLSPRALDDANLGELRCEATTLSERAAKDQS